MDMPLHPTWQDILIRLVLTMIAGAMIGFDRGARGHAAGLRTTMLVGLAAAVAMIQANILLSVGGKEAGSFGVMDLMRLPLGILTGVGFIGGGAILKHGGSVTGVTTAATLWIVTAIGLCFGGGQLALGVAATALGLITLSAMLWIDRRIPRECRASLVIATDTYDPTADLNDLLRPSRRQVHFRRRSRREDGQAAELQYEVRWTQRAVDHPPLELLKAIDRKYPVKSFEILAEGDR
jgi:putative Mg2+ transporter-C (MgtC) family protein